MFIFQFDGYTGFAIYSSISQGLDEITYGGRRSRRNSVTESRCDAFGFEKTFFLQSVSRIKINQAR